jgi:hypothetical protein
MKTDWNELFKAYELAIRMEFNNPKHKERVVEAVLECPELWNIIGITPEALDALQQNAYVYFRGLQRAHLIGRVDTRRRLVRHPATSAAQLKRIVCEGGQTVMCLAYQNKGINELPYITFDSTGRELFHGAGFVAAIGEDEIKFLSDLHNTEVAA